MIDKNIHQIWVGSFTMPNRETAFVEKVKAQYPEYTHYFWTDENLPELPENMREVYNRFYSIQNFAFCADMLRVFVVYKFGGYYFDVDFEFNSNNSIDDFSSHNGLFLYHNDTDFTIPNNAFGAERESPILEFCVQSMNSSCGWYGPSWFGMTIKKFLGLPNEIPQAPVAEQLRNHNYEYFHYGKFESQYARHWSLYSWSPEVWNKLKDGVYEG
jgi:mannosyltransferase OCH1-like enzyme